MFPRTQCHRLSAARAEGAYSTTCAPRHGETRPRRALLGQSPTAGQLFTFDPETEYRYRIAGICWAGEQTVHVLHGPQSRWSLCLLPAPARTATDSPTVRPDGSVRHERPARSRKCSPSCSRTTWTNTGIHAGRNVLHQARRCKGEKRLFILWNGAFVDHEEGHEGDTFGQCSVMVVNIPASERME